MAGCCNQLALFIAWPSDRVGGGGGKGRERLVPTARACTVMQILNKPIMYGYFLAYLLSLFTLKF